jgi:serine/threonine protein kinase/tetratricopeptide (TPR) repeat protein
LEIKVGRTLLHYELLDELGRGGMGEVYLALDTRLNRKLALKVLPPELSNEGSMLDRFKREAKTVAAINHPNIVTLYSIEKADDVNFITMELVEGKTLGEIIPRDGLPLPRFFRIAIPIADALSAAHRRSIVHRDLKPGNIMVSDDEQVKVLDFGLAKTFEHPLGADDASDKSSETLLRPASLTMTGQVAGTPRYMSPEQWRGDPIDHRSDIFSFGGILYEMATGRSPFGGDNAADLVSSIMRDVPPEIGEIKGELPNHLGRIVSQCLEKEPKNRFQTALGVRNQLHVLNREIESDVTLGSTARKQPVKAATGRRALWLRAAAVGAVLILGAVGAYIGIEETLRSDTDAQGSPRHATETRPSLAVLGFKNLGQPESAWLSTALAEIFSTELASGESLRLIAGESIVRMKVELDLPNADTFAANTLDKIRRSLGTDYVLIGSFLALPQEGKTGLSIQLRLQDTRDASTVAAFSETGTEDELFELVSRAGGALRRQLAVALPPPDTAAAVLATLSSSADAIRLYSEGLERLRHFDAVAARDFFQQAIAIDPDYALAHAALSRAWWTLGYERAAEESAARALDLASELPREEYLSIRGLYQEVSGDWEAAVKTHEVLWGFYADDLDHGLRLAQAQTQAGQLEAAATTIEAIRALPSPTREDPRIDLVEAQAAASASDYPRWLEASQRAAEKGRSQQASILVAEARFQEGAAQVRLGRPEPARVALADASQLFAAAGDRGRSARSLVLIAILLKYEGKLDEARALYEEILQTFDEIGFRRRTAELLINLAIVDRQQGDLASAEERLTESAVIARQIADRSTESAALENLSTVQLRLGHLEQAEASARQALAIAEEIGERSLSAWAQFDLGGIHAAAGKLDAARAAFAASEAIAKEIAYPHLQAYALAGLGRVAGASGDLAAGVDFLESSRDIRTVLGERTTLAETDLERAVLLLARDEAAVAAELARSAADEFARGGSRADEVQAIAVLSRALLALGQTDRARQALSRIGDYLETSQNVQARSRVGLAWARLAAASGDQEAARRRLESLGREARELGLAGIDLEIRLAQAEIALAGGPRGDAIATLKELGAEAQAAGFGLIARRTQSLTSESGPG